MLFPCLFLLYCGARKPHRGHVKAKKSSRPELGHGPDKERECHGGGSELLVMGVFRPRLEDRGHGSWKTFRQLGGYWIVWYSECNAHASNTTHSDITRELERNAESRRLCEHLPGYNVSGGSYVCK